MTEQINVLVFPCGSEIGMELYRSLKDIRFIHLIGASSTSDHGEFAYRDYIGGLPFITEPDFIERFNACLDRHAVDFIFAAMDNVGLVLSDHREELHAKLLGSGRDAVRICRSKEETYRALAGCDFLPRIYDSADAVMEFPVLLKPAVSQGSQGVLRIDGRAQLDFELERRTEPQVLCEYLPGEEYTVDCFTDRFGKLRYTAFRNRQRTKSGISVRSTLQPVDSRVVEIAEEINARIGFRGVWFFQLKRDVHGEYRLLECATRVAGTMCVERAAGVNLPLLTVFDAMEMDVDIRPQVDRVTVDRALYNVFRSDLIYDEVYLDFDDTLVVHGRVHMKTLGFCYQCKERGIPVRLLTRHETDIHADLRRFCVSEELFAEIICMPRSERKIDHVRPSPHALMIDDSYAERKAMEDAFGIRALGVDAVETLLEEPCE